VHSLSRRFPYESLSLLADNHFAQVAFDLVRALVPLQDGENEWAIHQHVKLSRLREVLNVRDKDLATTLAQQD
jgi:hypothetical protein